MKSKWWMWLTGGVGVGVAAYAVHRSMTSTPAASSTPVQPQPPLPSPPPSPGVQPSPVPISPSPSPGAIGPAIPNGSTVIIKPGTADVCENWITGSAYKYVIDSATRDGDGRWIYTAHHFLYLEPSQKFTNAEVVKVCS